MPEAVEICKLRLFLKLMSVVEPQRAKDNLGVEALPDIDFNIRSGNTLVGYATLAQVRESVEKETRGAEFQQQLMAFGSSDEVVKIEEQASIIDRAFRQFRRQQTELGGKVTSKEKDQLRSELRKLTDELDRFLAAGYGIKADRQTKKFFEWKSSHQPFHWFAEFFGIMATGGFNVIIGNPPWKEYSAVKQEYTITGYTTERCGNLHGLCTERALAIRDQLGRASFIVQLPIVSSSRMKSVRDSIRANSGEIHVIPFDDRPGKLFEGLEHCRSAIWLSSGERNNGCVQSTTRYQRWNSSVRSFLFPTITFAKNVTGTIFPDLVPKYDSDLESEVFRTVTSNSSTTIGAELSNASTKSFCFYQEATQYWVKAIFGLPFYAKNGIEGTPAHGRYLYFASAKEVHSVTALLNSSLFYAYFIAYSDCFHLSQTLVEAFPIPETLLSDQVLIDLNKKLMRDLAQNAETKIIRTRDGDEIKYAEFVVGRSKPIIDSIDRRLGEVYGLSDQQTEFLVNYDFKYRMGSQNE